MSTRSSQELGSTRHFARKVLTHTGPLESSLGSFEPTGRRQETRYCSVMRVKDGKVVEGRDYYDAASIVQQLGLVS
ncbi:ester cyclase [Ruegeria atlantica]|uniref:ester cyclase n=1 Tax=Ruegeria atlantica TaxID=81569 RepID=UPI0009E9D0C7